MEDIPLPRERDQRQNQLLLDMFAEYEAMMKEPMPRLRGSTTVKVKMLTGREIEIDLELTDTVDMIKERIEEQEGILPSQQRLTFGGRILADDKTAQHYHIEGGSVLHLVLATRGDGGC